MLGVVLCVIGILLLLTWPTQSSPQESEYLLFIERGRERCFESETTVPFRNSPLGLYERRGHKYMLCQAPFISRSTSTAVSRPVDTDSTTVQNSIRKLREPYYYGYKSIPPGNYEAQIEKNEKYEIALRLQTYRRNDGLVELQEPQTLIACTTTESLTVPGLTTIIDDITTIPVVTNQKFDVLIHGSPTKRWSHRDSQGCINLPKYTESAVRSEWDRFKSVLRARGIKKSIPLVLHDAPTDSAERPSLPIDYVFEAVNPP